MNCIQCNSNHYQRRGIRNGKQRYECQSCGCWYVGEIEDDYTFKKAPKILIFDIETSYMEVIAWRLGKQVIDKSKVKRDWHLISWAAKWLHDSEVYSDILTPEEAISGNDKRVVKSLWNMIDECDFLVSYNGNSFDIPKSNTRFIINGLNPPSSYKSIDVYQTVSRKFDFSSKSLDFVNMSLGLTRKKENSGLDLWKNCIAGNQESLNEMLAYNIGDVVSLEEDFLKFRPWINNYPQISLWKETNDLSCGFCGSENITQLSKKFSTPTGLYHSYRCKECGGLGRANANLIDKDKRKNILKNI